MKRRVLARAGASTIREPLDGRDLSAVGLDGEDGAALDRLAVQVNRARPAVGGVTADGGTGQPEYLAEVVDQ
jgi:hypothetical protein